MAAEDEDKEEEEAAPFPFKRADEHWTHDGSHAAGFDDAAAAALVYTRAHAHTSSTQKCLQFGGAAAFVPTTTALDGEQHKYSRERER